MSLIIVTSHILYPTKAQRKPKIYLITVFAYTPPPPKKGCHAQLHLATNLKINCKT